ncbi:MAG: threonine/serine dehydratase [Vulcanimicrobiaceae bacterium]
MSVPSIEVCADTIAQAHTLIAPHIRKTPVLELESLTLKLEFMQHAGSFKTRGAFMNLLSREIPTAGVVAASGGNHGAAVAYAAMTLRIPCKIFVPTISSPAKVQRIRDFGAELAIGGADYAEALAASEDWIARTGALEIAAFDSMQTITGQGTLAKELSEQADAFDTIVVAVGGGGLIGGIAAWYAGAARIVAVEPESAPTLCRALQAGCPVDAPAAGLAADSLAPRRVGALVFPIAQKYVSEVVLVSDAEIRNAQEMLWSTIRVAAEPGGATAFAAVLAERYRSHFPGRVAVIISGGNTVAVDFARQSTPSQGLNAR